MSVVSWRRETYAANVGSFSPYVEAPRREDLFSAGERLAYT